VARTVSQYQSIVGGVKQQYCVSLTQARCRAAGRRADRPDVLIGARFCTIALLQCCSVAMLFRVKIYVMSADHTAAPDRRDSIPEAT
jgi:hypothetical protein